LYFSSLCKIRCHDCLITEACRCHPDTSAADHCHDLDGPDPRSLWWFEIKRYRSPIVVYHCWSLPIVVYHCQSLFIDHCWSLLIIANHCWSLSWFEIKRYKSPITQCDSKSCGSKLQILHDGFKLGDLQCRSLTNLG